MFCENFPYKLPPLKLKMRTLEWKMCYAHIFVALHWLPTCIFHVLKSTRPRLIEIAINVFWYGSDRAFTLHHNSCLQTAKWNLTKMVIVSWLTISLAKLVLFLSSSLIGHAPWRCITHKRSSHWVGLRYIQT